MKPKLVNTILLVFFVFLDVAISLDEVSNEDGNEPDMAIRSLLHRYLMDGQSIFNPREAPEFDEAERKFQNETLEAHNALRARHCVPPLVLDEEINIRAHLFAEKLAEMDGPSLVHSTDRLGLYGENLYSVTRKTPVRNLVGQKVTNSWYSEISRYDYNNPVYSPSTGHFTQIVWKNTQRLGVGYAWAREGRKMFVVAQYAPPGNYAFAYRENVLKPTCE